jgi:hypothetical protein
MELGVAPAKYRQFDARTRSFMSHSVQSHLRVSPNEYDVQIRRFIPGYEEMLETVCRYLRYLANKTEKAIIVTELGSGGLTLRVARALPDVSIVAVDCDANMVDVARNRLASFSRQVKSVTETFDRGLRSPCNAVIASRALHRFPRLNSSRKAHCSPKRNPSLILA